METATTKGITIKVLPKYEPDPSVPEHQKHVFSYQVLIENNSNHTVQLMDRHWIIYDADKVKREVKGPGVIGKQPILKPGDSHSYASWSVLRTSMGKMLGSFNMRYQGTEDYFEVEIPEFKLIANFINN